jgi:hypothetical protein
MKIIKTKKGFIIEAFDNKPATYKADETYPNIIRPFEENKLKIIDTAYFIEEHLEMIITHYFFGRNIPENKDKSEKFKTLILTSDWCSFSSKRKLILHIINEKSLLKGSEKNDYENLLRKTMSYRNAFTHGIMSTNGDIVKLKFYEGGPKIKTIDDDYLSEIEKDLNLAFQLTFELAIKIGALVTHETIK